MSVGAVSVVVPAHNGECYLAECLQSVIGQTHPPMEVIVVDDGSDDDTAAVAAGFGPPVRVVTQARGGPASARNRGLEEARGGFVAFIDQDDLWRSDKLALQLAAFDADPSLDVSVTQIQRFRTSRTGKDLVTVGDPVPGYLTVTMLARRAAFARIGPLDSSLTYSDSAEWFVRAREKALKVRLLPDVLAYHRNHGANLSELSVDQAHSEFLRLAKMQMEKARRRGTPAPGDG
jgi:glycosyltransferase involved in cell wall biosynthesis